MKKGKKTPYQISQNLLNTPGHGNITDPERRVLKSF
jgi:hypothetical protein